MSPRWGLIFMCHTFLHRCRPAGAEESLESRYGLRTSLGAVRNRTYRVWDEHWKNGKPNGSAITLSNLTEPLICDII